MAGKSVGAAGHFGRQMRKERLAHGCSMPEFSARIGFDAGHLSRVLGPELQAQDLREQCVVAVPAVPDRLDERVGRRQGLPLLLHRGRAKLRQALESELGGAPR